jgi:hypothetical protein
MATEAGSSHNGANPKGLLSAGNVFDVFAYYEEEFQPSKRRRLSSPSDSGPGAKHSCSLPTATLSVGRAPLPVNNDNQYTVERLLRRSKRNRVIKYLVK